MSQGPWPQPSFEAPLLSILERASGRTATAAGAGPTGARLAGAFAERLARQLLLAAESGDVGAAANALSQRADPNSSVAATGASALHLACASGAVDLVRLLAEASASANSEDASGRTPLDAALIAGSGQAAASLLLLQPPGVLETLEDSRERWAGAIAALVDVCPAPASSSRYVGKPYSQANEELLDAVAQLLHDIHKPREVPGFVHKLAEARDVLFSCVSRAHLGGVTALLRSGAIDSVDRADPRARRTAYELARALFEPAAAPEEAEMCVFLRAHGAAKEFNPMLAEFALLLAAARGDEASLKFWLARVGTPDWREPPPPQEPEEGMQCTALMFAALEGRYECVRLLLAAGARADLLDADGRSASQLARQRGYASLADELDRAVAGLQKRQREELMPPNPWRAPPGWKEVEDLPQQTRAVRRQNAKPAKPRTVALPMRLLVRCESVRGIVANPYQLSFDPYVQIRMVRKVQGAKVVLQQAQTDIVNDNDPIFNQGFEFNLEHQDSTIEFQLLDTDASGLDDPDFLGRYDVNMDGLVERLLERETISFDRMLRFQWEGATSAFIKFDLRLIEAHERVNAQRARKPSVASSSEPAEESLAFF